MDGMTFAVEMAKALGWPLTVLILAAAFRKPFYRLIKGIRLRRLKYGDAEMEFDARFAKVKREIPDAKPASEPPLPGPSAEDDLPEFAPNGAVLWAWSKVEERLRLAARQLDLPGDPTKLNQLLGVLTRRRALSEQTLASIQGLRHLRNLVAHSTQRRPVTPERAREYVAMAEAVIFSISQDFDEYASGGGKGGSSN